MGRILVVSACALATVIVAVACGSTETTSTPSGQGGSAPTTTVTSSVGGASVGGSGGRGGGAACATPADCGVDDTCITHTCDTTCGAVITPKGTPCGDNGGNVCGDGSCVAWAILSSTNAPTARSEHVAVWTGTHMIVWGGRVGPGLETASGHLYDPATDSWAPMSATDAPSPRHSHRAVWTGTEMIVWGGFGEGASKNDGAAYDPTSDTWRALPPVAISGRTDHVMEWSGTEVLIWGGRNGVSLPNEGARYNPETNTWGPMAPFPLGGRFNVITAWVSPVAPTTTGALVVWGGSNLLDWFDDGAFWDPATNTWTTIADTYGPPPMGGNVPAHSLEGSTSVAFNNALYIWAGWDGGNHYDEGYFIDLTQQVGGYWLPISPMGETPAARRFHSSVASTKTLGFFVWGGCSDSSCQNVFGDGGYWSQAGFWEYIPEDPALTARSDTTMINTGDEVIVWGGVDTQGSSLADGARRLMPDPTQ